MPILLDLLLDKSSKEISNNTAYTLTTDSVLLSLGLLVLLVFILWAAVLDARLPRFLNLIREAYVVFPRDQLLHNAKIVEEYCADDD